MGADIHGWIEINTINFSDEDLWFGVVRIDLLAERNYLLFAHLFGVRGSEADLPIAESRGIPPNVSFEVLSEEWFVKFGEKQTWILASEIVWPRLIQALYEESWGWHFLVEVIHKLSERYGSKNVRLTVCFDNA